MARLLASARFASVVLALVCAAAARADDPPSPAALRPGDVARALVPPEEKRTIAFEALAGTRCTLTLRRSGKARYGPTVKFVSPEGERVDVKPYVREARGSTTVRNVPVSATGTWRTELSLPRAQGGTFTATVAARVPRQAALRGTTGGAEEVRVVFFDALSGSRADVDVVFAGRRGEDVRARLVAADGTEIAQAVGRGAARVRGAVVPSVGPVGVEVSGAAGDFVARVRVAPPKGRRTLTFEDVEPLPVVKGVTPRDVDNDGFRGFVIDGFGFTDRQRVLLLGPSGGPQPGVPSERAAGGATVAFDLDDVAAGTYTMAVLLPGRSVAVPGSIVVRNRAAAFGEIDPVEAPSDAAFDLRVTGSGFDPGTTFELRAAAGGALLPLGAVTRSDPRTLTARAFVSPFTYGVHDLTIREPSGAKVVRSAAFDLLGRRGPGAALTSLAVHGGAYAVYDAALDPQTGRAVLAVQEDLNAGDGRVAFVLVDTGTWSVLDVARPALHAPPRSTQWGPRVRFHPVDRTWALSWFDRESGSSPVERGKLRLADADDLDAVRAERVVASSSRARSPMAIPDAAAGGWLVAWETGFDGLPGQPASYRVGTTRWTAGGDPVAGSTRVFEDDPTIVSLGVAGAQRPDGRFVIAYLRHPGQVVCLLLEPDGTIGPAGYRHVVEDVLPSEGILTRLVVAAAADDGTALVVYALGAGEDPTSIDGHALVVPADGSRPTAPRMIANDGVVDPALGIYSTYEVVWNPARREFVVAYTDVGYASVLLRVGKDGLARTGVPRQAYDGIHPVPFAGPSGETLHLARIVDPTGDGVHDPNLAPLTLHAMPIR